jgi:hypothetical protein
LDRTQVVPTYKGPLQERSLDIGKALNNVTLIQSSLDCRANVEQFNHQCFERSVKICENNNNGYDKIKVANGIQQRSYNSFFWSGNRVCVFWQFWKVLKGLSNSREKNLFLYSATLIEWCDESKRKYKLISLY